MPLEGRKMKPREAYGLAYKAGWTKADKGFIVVAIAIAESELYIGAYNDKNKDGSIDRGWMQINSVHNEFDPDKLLTDPLYCAKAAYAVYKGARYTFRPWAAFNTGRHKHHIPDALLAQQNYWRIENGFLPL